MACIIKRQSGQLFVFENSPIKMDSKEQIRRAVVQDVQRAEPGATVTIDAAMSRIGKAHPQMGEQERRRFAIEGFRAAEEAGLGRLFIGRRGQPTRFVRAGASDLPKPRSGETRVTGLVESKTAAEWLEVPFPIRPGIIVKLIMPANLSAAELTALRSRIAGYLSSGEGQT